MPIREIKLKSDKEQIFEHFSEGAQPLRSIFQGWLEPPSPIVVGAYVCDLIHFEGLQMITLLTSLKIAPRP